MTQKEPSDEDVAKILFKLDFKLPNGQRVTGNFQPATKIDYDSLEEQLAETPSQFAWWSSLLAEQRTKVQTIEKQISRRRAKLTEQFFNNGQKDGVRIHKYLIDELVEADDQMLKLDAKLIEANRVQSKLWAAVQALQMKSEHLRSLAGFKKQEMRDSS